jgi:hypothetical protein
MRWLAVLTLVVVVAGAAWAQPTLQPPIPGGGEVKEPPKQVTSGDQTKPAPDQRGTEATPLVAKVIMPQKTQKETAQDAEDREEKTSSDRWMVVLTGAIVFVGFIQTAVFGIQAAQLRATVRKMDEVATGQTRDMQDSIKEATRAASAMEGVAASMAINAAQIVESVATSKEIAARQKVLGEMQLRSYLSVIIGGGFYQDRAKGNYFQGTAALVNQGHTPATKVVHRTRAAILPVPLADDFVLPALPEKGAGESMMGPQQNRVLSSAFLDFCADDEVEDIKKGLSRGLYFWGEVTYEDAFGQNRVTTFCHLLTWRPDGKSWGYYTPNRNTAT